MRLFPIGGVVAVLTAFAVVPSAPAQARTTSTPPGPTTITLITGDTVTVRPGGTAVQAPEGAHVTTVGPDTYVYPDGVLPYISTGLLDKRLFNITYLLREGYADDKAAALPVILGYSGDAAAKKRVLPEASTDVRALPSINGRAVTTDRSRAGDFWSDLTAVPATGFANGISKVWLDGRVHASLADSVAQIGAPAVWAGGNTGGGVDVAVLDTGVDTGHPDLAGRIESTASFVPGEDVTDGHGHGTHVASTIAGTGAASGGTERGVAPGADLEIGKVLNNGGEGYDSWIISGMEWAARDRKAKVISMSLGGGPTDGTDPMSVAVNELSAETGALFVIAAGNSGPAETTVGSPGAADAALTVGAVDANDQLAEFSSRGPRLVDGALKPEITAPGVDILAARSQYSTEGEGFYRTMSGTSMATPHVAGAAALLAAQHPGWTGPQLKDALVSTAKQTPDLSAYEAGSGRLDIAATTTATVFATATAYLGIHPLSDEPTGTAEQPITYTNTGTAAVDLDLRLDGPELIRLSAAHVSVPAGGTATVTVSAELGDVPAKGRFTGSVVASTGGVRVADTVVGLSTEDKPRHLTITPTGRGGEPMPGSIMLLRDGDPAGSYYNFVTFDGGPVDVLVPQGRYAVWMWGEVEGSHGPNSRGMALVSEPTVVVEQDTTVELKAAATREVQAITPKPTATAELRLDYHRELGDTASATDSFMIPRYYDSVWATPGQKARDGKMSVTARWRKTQPILTIGDTFDDLILLPGSTPPAEGTQQIPAVFAGKGTASDFAKVDVKDKIAVVRRGELDDQVELAGKAGAVVLAVVNDEPGRYFDATYRTKLAVVSLSKDGGERLITQLGKGAVSLRVESQPTTDYLYDLVRYWPDGLPKSVTYRPAERDLARVDVDFQSTSDREISERRYDYNPDMPVKVGSTGLMRSDRFRTDWVTAQPGVQWSSDMDDLYSFQLGGSTTYPAGSRTSETWLGAIQRPRINDAVTLPRRDGDRIVAEIPGWGDSGANHAGVAFPDGGEMTATLTQGRTVVEQNAYNWIDSNSGLSPKRLPYRLVATTQRDSTNYPYSTRTRTIWDFVSDAKTSRLPLIQLDYRVDTDLAHRAARSAAITVSPSHLPGAPSTKSITSAALDVSYDDGATWQSQRLRRTAAGWTANLRAPRTAQHVTLRTSAKDKDGNRVEQTITRAFGLK
ncbi:S8 family peptidase [Actinoplanes derwentensis]|uniref:Serine protease, subtilisin family n=1 Tax=Actinoplanes derwentensis TaxID=113562 RepID=A0A1H1X1A0_9ACTN|nr:S8 family serine peptidase [Actinoplanes derwentensis]GID85760.1 peptidase [Actinoplanes derwentensis]SDT02830.1 Serine protease, subtilisin family [Actinoplanes derwentensis]